MQLKRTTEYGMPGPYKPDLVSYSPPVMLEDDRPHFFRHLGPQWWERRGDVIVGGATVQPNICVPGLPMPRISMLATYADNAGGLDASLAFGSVAPTLDLSVHVVRAPSTADLSYESRLIKVGRRVSVAETWFRADGEADPYAVAISTFVIVSEPDPHGITLPSHLDAPFSPPLALETRIEDHAGITVVEPGVVDIEHAERREQSRHAPGRHGRPGGGARGARRCWSAPVHRTWSPASISGTCRRCGWGRSAPRPGCCGPTKPARSSGSRSATSATTIS